jgi:hypothetical protein
MAREPGGLVKAVKSSAAAIVVREACVRVARQRTRADHWQPPRTPKRLWSVLNEGLTVAVTSMASRFFKERKDMQSEGLRVRC